jgi:hypothetical protein
MRDSYAWHVLLIRGGIELNNSLLFIFAIKGL